MRIPLSEEQGRAIGLVAICSLLIGGLLLIDSRAHRSQPCTCPAGKVVHIRLSDGFTIQNYFNVERVETIDQNHHKITYCFDSDPCNVSTSIVEGTLEQ